MRAVRYLAVFLPINRVDLRAFLSISWLKVRVRIILVLTRAASTRAFINSPSNLINQLRNFTRIIWVLGSG